MACSLEKLLAQLGLGSRKECRALVLGGCVVVSGETIDDPYAELAPVPKVITVDGEEVDTRVKLYVMLNKPEGVECSHRPQHHESVFSLLPARWVSMGLHCVGRLDVDTTGLLLLSNQGDFIHHVESPRKGLGKVYHAMLADPLTASARAALLEGVELRSEKGLFKALALEDVDDGRVAITVGEGVYHQVKRMFAAVGNKVVHLHRVAIGSVTLDSQLEPGAWRYLSVDELQGLGVTVPETP